MSQAVSSSSFPSASSATLPEVICQIAHKRVRVYHKNDVLLSDLSRYRLHILCEGKVKTGLHLPNGKVIIQDIINAEGVFGGLAERGTCSFAQVASDWAHIVTIDLDELSGLPWSVQSYVYRMMNQRIQQLERQLGNMLGKEVPHRVVNLLCRLARQQGERIGFETKITTGLTHADLAMLVGSSRQTVTTILSQLRKKNLINYNRRYLLIRDLNHLETINQQASVLLNTI